MSVVINASIDGTSYGNITKIVTGGKEINLSGVADGSGLPAGIAEITMGTYEPDADKTSTQSIAHGCSGTPDIIIMYSDFRTHYTSEIKPSNSTIVSEIYNAPGSYKGYATVSVSYTGSTKAENNGVSTDLDSTNDGFIIDVGSTTFSVKAVSNRRLGAGLTYTWIAIRLA